MRAAEMKSSEEWSSQLWTQFMQLRKRSPKKIHDFNVICTRDLAIPVRRSNQLTPMKLLMLGTGHVFCIARSRVQIPLKSWIFWRLLLRNCINCVHNCQDHSSLDKILLLISQERKTLRNRTGNSSNTWKLIDRIIEFNRYEYIFYRDLAPTQ